MPKNLQKIIYLNKLVQIVQINRQSLPIRCEICHQTDLFDAQNNICYRCSNINIEETNNLNNIVNQTNSLISNNKFNKLLILPGYLYIVITLIVINVTFGTVISNTNNYSSQFIQTNSNWVNLALIADMIFWTWVIIGRKKKTIISSIISLSFFIYGLIIILMWYTITMPLCCID